MSDLCTINDQGLWPTSAAISMHANILNFCNATKWLLLFYERPIMVLGTYGLQSLDEEIVSEYRRTGVLRSNPDGDGTELTDYDILATDEWDGLVSQCDSWSIGWDIGGVSDEQKTAQSQLAELLGLGRRDSTLSVRFPELSGGDENTDTMLADILCLVFLRAQKIMEMIKERNASAVWTDGIEQDMVQLMLRRSLGGTPSSGSSEGDCVSQAETLDEHQLRALRGKAALEYIARTRMPSLSVIPVSRIVEFRERNRDMLEHFWTKHMRDLLGAITMDAASYDVALQAFATSVSKGLAELNAEIGALRRPSAFKWLERASSTAYEAGKIGACASVFGFLGAPLAWLLLSKSAASAAKDDIVHDRLAVARSSVGYVWSIDDALIHQKDRKKSLYRP